MIPSFPCQFEGSLQILSFYNKFVLVKQIQVSAFLGLTCDEVITNPFHFPIFVYLKCEMSDCYPICDPLVHICSPPEKQLHYILKQWECGNDVVFWIGIQNEALIQWHKVKRVTPALTYVNLLNGLIPGHAFKIVRNCERIESRLSGRCCAVSCIQPSLNRTGNSLKRKQHGKNIYKLAVLKSEVYSVER